MGLEVGIGLSSNPELAAAARAAVEGALKSCQSPALVLLFVTHNYGIEEIREAIPAIRALAPAGATLAGGTVNGLVRGAERYDSLVNARAVAALALGGVRVAAALTADPRPDPAAAGRALARDVAAALGEAPQVGMIFTPGLSAGARLVDQPLLDAIRAEASGLRLSGTGLTGGMSDQGMSLPGLGFLGDRVETLGTLLVAFPAAVHAHVAVENGAVALHRSARVTGADGNVVRTLDDRPARDVMLDRLAGEQDDARAHFSRNALMSCVEHSVSFARLDPQGFAWCEPPVAALPDGSILDFFEPPVGSTLDVVRIEPESALAACRSAGASLAKSAGARPVDLVVWFSCGIRGFSLGPLAAREAEELEAPLHPKNQLGIMANGEIGCRGDGPPTSTAWAFSALGLSAEEA